MRGYDYAGGGRCHEPRKGLDILTTVCQGMIMLEAVGVMHQCVQPVISGSDPSDLWAMLEKDSGKLAFLKNNLSSVFEKVGSFLLDSSRELDSFKKLIKPYLDYFYPQEVLPNTECFVNEVVEPGRREMEATINRAVAIMQGDSEVNGRVSTAIREALEIQPIVNSLIEMIEAIETYSWNAMLMSTKAGMEGQALAKISEQVSNLSTLANNTAENCTGIIDSLNSRYDEFDAICHKIDIINENYLTQMSVKGGMIFREIKNELSNLSGSVNHILECAVDVEGAINTLMNRLQMEDLVRQDIEKVVFLVEEINAVRDRRGILVVLHDFDAPTRIEEFLIALMRKKFGEIYENTHCLVSGIESYRTNIKEIINGFLGRFYGKQGSDEIGYYEGTRFDAICTKLERMKDEFVGYIEEIIARKKKLYQLSMEIVQTMEKFGILFDEIGKISRRFEIINLLTKIELAKHADLKKSIGGSLTDVSNLPAVMKKIVENALQRYREVMSSIEMALNEYHANYEAEEDALITCIDAMRKISVKMFESQKYYRDISEKVGSTGIELLAFMETREEECSMVRDIVDIIYDFMCRLEKYDAGELKTIVADEALKRHVKWVSEKMLSREDEDSYRVMLLKSLLSEAVRESESERVVLF